MTTRQMYGIVSTNTPTKAPLFLYDNISSVLHPDFSSDGHALIHSKISIFSTPFSLKVTIGDKPAEIPIDELTGLKNLVAKLFKLEQLEDVFMNPKTEAPFSLLDVFWHKFPRKHIPELLGFFIHNKFTNITRDPFYGYLIYNTKEFLSINIAGVVSVNVPWDSVPDAFAKQIEYPISKKNKKLLDWKKTILSKPVFNEQKLITFAFKYILNELNDNIPDVPHLRAIYKHMFILPKDYLLHKTFKLPKDGFDNSYVFPDEPDFQDYQTKDENGFYRKSIPRTPSQPGTPQDNFSDIDLDDISTPESEIPTPIASPVGTPKISPQETKQIKDALTKQQSPVTTPFSTSIATPFATPVTTPVATPFKVPESLNIDFDIPLDEPETPTQMTPVEIHAVPEDESESPLPPTQISKRARKNSPRKARKSSPRKARKSSPKRARKSSPKRARKSSPKRARKSSPKRARKSSPRKTRKSSPRKARKSSPRKTRKSSPRKAQKSSPRKARKSSPRKARKSVKKSPRKAQKSSPRKARKSVKKSPQKARKSVKKSPRKARKSSPRKARKSVKKSPRKTRKSTPKSARKSVKKSPRKARKSTPKRAHKSSPKRAHKSSPKHARKSVKKVASKSKSSLKARKSTKSTKKKQSGGSYNNQILDNLVKDAQQGKIKPKPLSKPQQDLLTSIISSNAKNK